MSGRVKRWLVRKFAYEIRAELQRIARMNGDLFREAPPPPPKPPKKATPTRLEQGRRPGG
jgi:hypothetical protein